MKLALRRIPFVLMVAIGGSYVLLRTVLPILSLFHVDIEINDNAVVLRSYSYILPTGPHFGPHLPLHS